jgi:dihydrofolate reductase
MLLGRVTYQGFAAAFGAAPEGNPDGDFMNKQRKYVVSRTLESADWQNSTLIKGDAVAGIARLKQELDGDLMISGSCSLVHTLAQAGMVDEYQLLVYPVVLGKGKRLFPEGLRQDLELVDSRQFQTGVVRLTLRPKQGA